MKFQLQVKDLNLGEQQTQTQLEIEKNIPLKTVVLGEISQIGDTKRKKSELNDEITTIADSRRKKSELNQELLTKE